MNAKQTGRKFHGIGARTMDHLKANLKALDLPLTAEQMASLDAVSKPGLDFPPNLT